MPVALENLIMAIEAVKLQPVPINDAGDQDEDNHDDEDGIGSSPPRKKRRKRECQVLVDPFHVWVHVTRNEEDLDDSGLQVAADVGGKLVALSVGGILNGMAKVEGGVTTKPTPSAESLKASGAQPNIVSMLPIARAWHAAVQKQVQHDIIAVTPRRIRDHLCPQISDKDFANIRKRVYKTAVQGEGLHTDEVTDVRIPFAAAAVTSEASFFTTLHSILTLSLICFAFHCWCIAGCGHRCTGYVS
jgi:hypothetical protein